MKTVRAQALTNSCLKNIVMTAVYLCLSNFPCWCF